MIFYFLLSFVFCHLNFIVSFPYLIKYYHIMFIIIVYCLGSDRLLDFFFIPTLLLSIPQPLFLPSLSVSLSYFILVPMLEFLGKHSFMSSPFPKAIPNGTCIFLTVELQVYNENPV